MFTKLVFDRGDSNLECFNRTIYNYGVPVTYGTRDIFFYLCWVNESCRVHVPWLSQGWLSLSFL